MIDTKIQTKKIISYLTFNLDREHFALNVGKVVNILEMQKITKVPKLPDYITGIINLRGEVLPVIDTNIKLGLQETAITGNTCILVIECSIADSITRFGMLVDGVQEVLEIDDDQILPPPSIGTKYGTKIISGVVDHSEQFIMILDIHQLLGFDDVIDLQNIKESFK